MNQNIITLILFIFGWSTLFAQAEEDKKLVVATASIFADMAENIVGDHVEVRTIVPIGSDPHLYTPKPSDAKLISQADLVLRNEMTFEGWLRKLINNSDTNAEIVTITEGVNAITSQEYENAADPHAWMDLSNGLVYIKNIKDALVKIDPDNKEEYEINYGVYKQQLEDLDQYIMESIQSIPPEQRILITSHDAFQYYGRRYGIKLESIMGISTETEAQASDIQEINKAIQRNKVPAVFIETTINPKMLQQIAEDNNVKIGGELYADSIGEPGSDGDSYLDMLRHNTDVIVAALRQPLLESVTTNEPEESSNYLIWVIIGLLFFGSFAFVAKKVTG